MNGAVDAIVCGVGSGGTLTGLYRYFARVQPELEIVLADPAGSVLAQHVRGGRRESWHASVVEGIGCDSIPPLADLSGVNQAITVEDYESLGVVRELFLRCGILAGPSTGTLVAAAIRYCRQQHWPKRVLTFACDDGARYLSKVFDDSWLSTHGFSQLSDPRPAPDLEHLRRC
jgi:cystathionine beta-synthase